MSQRTTRRRFLETTTAAGALLGGGSLGFLSQLPRAAAEEPNTPSQMVALRPEIEPLVRMIEETPREKLLEAVGSRIHDGLAYRDVLAALLLAGVRNIQPRPSVGFKFHAVLVVNSAHLASLASPDEHRWLPIFWALDHFKDSQQDDVNEGDWHMTPVDESAVPAADKVGTAFQQAMDQWDVSAADAAVAGMARYAGIHDTFERFFRLGARDFRSIGHKAIFVANSYRTLQCIGWQHAEPVMRSLAYALLNHQGEPNPAQSDLAPDQPWRRNRRLAKQLRADWAGGRIDPMATTDLLATLRTGTPDECCDQVVATINAGVHPQSVWDALLLGGGELLFRQRGIVALHSLTTGNALHFAYQTSRLDDTRRMMLLQCAAFVPLFRDALAGRGRVRDFEIDALQPAELEATAGGEMVAEVFSTLSNDRDVAARQVLGALGSDQVNAQQVIDAGRLLVFLKRSGSHDYKFSSAVMEDYYHVSPQWRDRFLAAGVFNLRAAGDRGSSLVARTQAALG